MKNVVISILEADDSQWRWLCAVTDDELAQIHTLIERARAANYIADGVILEAEAGLRSETEDVLRYLSDMNSAFDDPD